jgi:hypothetical protein
MVTNKKRPRGLLAILAGAVVLGSGPGPARAQWGFGPGLIPFNPAPSPTDFLNQHAAINAARGQQAPASFRPYANNPNSFHNRLRDNSFVPSYDVRRRRRSSDRPQAVRSLGNTARATAEPEPAPAAPSPRPAPPLASYFDASQPQQLVWPGEAPVTGILGKKRDLAGYACLIVLEETRLHHVASITTVTAAREKLLDYGRPALEHVRMESTATIANMFHDFLLSLYDSLARAASAP